MDEATSSMDYVTEKTTFELMFETLKDKSMLIIAHRLSTIRNCDRIYYLESGKIAESGTHDELMEKKGAYFRLWTSQIEGAAGDSDEEIPESVLFRGVEPGDVTYE